jgi:hypothetical protein
MDVIKKNAEKYGLQKVGKNCHKIIKILKEYENEQEAVKTMTQLLTGEITEHELSDTLEQVEDTKKLGNRILCLEAALEGIRDDLMQAIEDKEQFKTFNSKASTTHPMFQLQYMDKGIRLEKVARETIKRINDFVEGKEE